MRKSFFWISVILHTPLFLLAQTQSSNGFWSSTYGDVRVLVIFAEINYDDAQYNGPKPNWDTGQLPSWAGDVFDPSWTGSPQAQMTRYYSEMSFGTFHLLGDYLDQVITINEQDITSLTSHGAVRNQVIITANSLGGLSTANSYTFPDFDNWDDPNPGVARTNFGNQRYDHIMIIMRNWKDQSASAVSSTSMPTPLYGNNLDAWSVFNTSSFDIWKHEFGHLLLGGNNFHASGGHDKGSTATDNQAEHSYYLASQGGWGILGNAGSSIKTANAWERRRLDWKGPGKTMKISCGQGNAEVSGDINATNMLQEGTYVLRDFVTTGDAIRIRLPFVASGEFPQWLWIENHQGFSDFDNHDNVSCQTPFQKGLCMYVQCDKENLLGASTFDGYADCLKPLAAMGMHDVELGNSIMTDQCVAGGASNPFTDHWLYEYTLSNPLTGYSDLQQFDFDKNSDGKIYFAERTVNYTESHVNGLPQNIWSWRGHLRHAFHNTSGGNLRIGIGTNPTSASQLTLVSGDEVLLDQTTNLPLAQNNRTIYLNGISVEITNYNAGTGEITVDVQFDQVHLDEDVRWCADDIYLPDMASQYSALTAAGWSLIVDPGVTMLLDRNKMPTRIDNPETVTISGTSHTLFNSATSFRMEPGAAMTAGESSTIRLDNGSTFTLGQNNELNLDNAELEVMNGSTLILDEDSYLNLSGSGGSVFIDESSTLIIRQDASINLAGNGSYIYIDGTVIIEDGGELAFAGNGHLVFDGVIQNDDGSAWILNGRDKDDLVLVVLSTAQWTGGTVSFNSGRIDYAADDVSIEINAANQCTMNDVRFDGMGYGYVWSGVTALEFDDVEASITDCEFLDFETGISLANGTGTTEIHDSYFDQNIYSINVVESETLEVADCEIISVGNLPSGGISYYNTGIDATNTDQVRVDATSISAAAHGVKLASVDGYYMRSGSIIGCDYGLTGESSLVFLRNGATIKNTLEYAIGLNSADPLNSMLTIGDLGCGNLHNNDEAMWAFGTTLNIDAYIHASNSGTPSFVQHNRLDQNPFEAIDACYHNAPGLFVPPVIYAKGNYWNESGGIGIAPAAGLIESRYSSTMLPWFCGTSSTAISVDHSQFTTCVPQAVCDCFLGTAPVGGGSFDGIANKMPIPSEITLPVREPDAHLSSFEAYGTSEAALKAIVLENYIVANRAFLEADNPQTRDGFRALAAIGLEKNNNDWIAKTTSGRALTLDNESIHRVIVAKVLTKTPLGGAAEQDIFADYFDWAAKENLKPSTSIFPNPSNGTFSLMLSGFEAVYSYTVLTELGTEMEHGTLQSGTNTMELASLKAGVYTILVFSKSGEVVAKEKLVVQ